MKIILKESVEKLGVLGDIVNVRPGYGRNFLIPYGKAILATEKNIEFFKNQRSLLKEAEEKLISETRAKAHVISNKKFTIKVRSGDGGKIFGSVGSKEIADVIKSDTGIIIKRRNIRMPEGNFRYLGSYEISIYLDSSIKAKTSLSIES